MVILSQESVTGRQPAMARNYYELLSTILRLLHTIQVHHLICDHVRDQFVDYSYLKCMEICPLLSEVCEIVHGSNVLTEVSRVCSLLDGCVQHVPEAGGKGLSQCDAVIVGNHLTSWGGLSPAEEAHKSLNKFYAFNFFYPYLPGTHNNGHWSHMIIW